MIRSLGGLTVKEIGCREAHEGCAKNPDALIIDVRAPGEYAAGHPAGALNVPIMLGSPGAFSPNPDFLAVMEKVAPKGTTLYLSCQSGNRSGRAGALLEQNGWTDVANIRAGWGGARNFLGQVTEQGWSSTGLPIEQGEPADRGWEGLKKKK
jgi:rhodanese-related sulfurtransferase